MSRSLENHCTCLRITVWMGIGQENHQRYFQKNFITSVLSKNKPPRINKNSTNLKIQLLTKIQQVYQKTLLLMKFQVSLQKFPDHSRFSRCLMKFFQVGRHHDRALISLMKRGFQVGPQLGPHDAEKRQSLIAVVFLDLKSQKLLGK